MRKRRNIVLWLFFTILTGEIQLNAQVVIGKEQNPQKFSILELISVPTINVGGLRLPQLSDADKTAINAELLAHPDESRGLFIYSTAKDCLEYWNGSQWVDPGAGNEIALPWQISPKSPVQKNIADVADSIYHAGTVNIGSSDTDPSAILNVQSSNQGVLMPRVALDSATDVKTIPSPAIGLLVYNTGNKTTFPTEGYLFWDGTQWKIFANASSAPAAATLHCESAAMNPSQQVMDGVPLTAGTLLQIPYSGSNGGNYKGVTFYSTNGGGNITATIESGTLAIGNGVLSFLLSGTPTIDQQAPNGIQFDLSAITAVNPGIMGSCGKIPIGNIVSASILPTAVMGSLVLTRDSLDIISSAASDSVTSNYTLQCNSPDGKWSVRVVLPKSTTGMTYVWRTNQNLNIQIRNNMSDTTRIIWNYDTVWSGGQVRAAYYLDVPPQRWGADNDSGFTWYYASYPTGYGGSFWGNVGIYDGNGPEYRRYTWIPLGANNKVAYEVHIMVALDAIANNAQLANVTSYTPDMLKAYIKLEEVVAN